ncbi:Hypothetical protein ORPV_405 [Orpheovirus IHUMI-LCC2]|uniref:Uncharacterized protein n=1 Tax=Orpheovirus IHUMI-LCC2 TaxID=2023057 RepID=A0A2I2L4B8_9VIRU|nr:Hypothetical protein ORPV_405 [Orpheovirus IHUMI-LCC2]SNW62309.1 Hypothetical protein ORPV_405 [Orpheovirus IHUMI-LCC2]
MEGNNYNVGYEVIYNYLYPLSYSNIINYCRTNTYNVNICDDDYFWMTKFNLDYPEEEGIIPFDLPPKEFFREIEKNNIKSIPIYKRINGNKVALTEIWISKEENIYDIVSSILEYDVPKNNNIMIDYIYSIDDNSQYLRYMNQLIQSERHYLSQWSIQFIDDKGDILLEFDDLNKKNAISNISTIWNELNNIYIGRKNLRLGEMDRDAMSYLYRVPTYYD